MSEFDWSLIRKAIVDIMWDCETTQGYEDDSHIMPINGLTDYDGCADKIIEYLKGVIGK